MVEVDGQCVLFDTGRNPNTVIRNARALDVDLSCVTDVVLSHFHFDHTTGLLPLLRELRTRNPEAVRRVHVASGFFLPRRKRAERENTMEISRRGTRSWAVVAALLFLAPSAARADDPCREQCREARIVCHRAVHAAYRACRTHCEDLIQEATRQSVRVCIDEGLSPEQCQAVVRQAVAAATEVCHRHCRVVLERARERCEQERRHCFVVCLPPLDPECAEGCYEDLALCRDDLGRCIDACDEDSVCAEECHAALRCGAGLRECAESCVIEEP